MTRGRVLNIPTPRVFLPLLEPSRYKGAYGGRGSGKSHFFAELAVETAIRRPGSRGVCIREVQKSLKESAKMLIEDKVDAFGAGNDFRCLVDQTQTPGGGIIIYRGMQDYNKESIKSLEGFDWAWVEEATTLSQKSLEMLRPTIRRGGSELWFSWNPVASSDPVDAFFRRGDAPPDSVMVMANYPDNPFFPEVLELERQHDLKYNPDRYNHIWEGGYAPQVVGAIFTMQAINENRRTETPDLQRILVGVDHATSSEPGANEHGIIVGGLGDDGRGYVVDDATVMGPPEKWARMVVDRFDWWQADAVVVERNQGGDLVRQNLRTARPGLPIIEVHATRGKHVRAEPIASLYNHGRISHVGPFPELEAQLCQITNAGYEGPSGTSPDRADAMVWVMSELFNRMIYNRPNKQKDVRRPVPSASGWMG